ncbi:hypothetical protein G7046_g9742 [Stylonectria norvegica]|nr:hypothetical protein G7046_g9742 [Stylonectria norvegica]
MRCVPCQPPHPIHQARASRGWAAGGRCPSLSNDELLRWAARLLGSRLVNEPPPNSKGMEPYLNSQSSNSPTDHRSPPSRPPLNYEVEVDITEIASVACHLLAAEPDICSRCCVCAACRRCVARPARPEPPSLSMGGPSPISIEPWEMLARAKFVKPPPRASYLAPRTSHRDATQPRDTRRAQYARFVHVSANNDARRRRSGQGGGSTLSLLY